MFGDTNDARAIEAGDRSFLIERDTTTSGWVLREAYGDGWPVMGGPFPTAASATAYIDTLVDAGPLCDYEDDECNQACWV